MSDQAVILLAEVSENDALLTRRAFAKANLLNPLQVVRDGVEAIAYSVFRRSSGRCGLFQRGNIDHEPILHLSLDMRRKSAIRFAPWLPLRRRLKFAREAEPGGREAPL